MDRCKKCRYWIELDERDWPLDLDTDERIKPNFGVRQCKSPRLLFHEMPVTKGHASVWDGSHYWAGLYTAEDFGCVNWEKES